MKRALTALLAVFLVSLLTGCDGSTSSRDPDLGVSPSGSGGAVVQSATFPLHVSSDGRRLEDNRGRGFRINGDTAWSLMVKLTKAEAQLYLDDRRARGFNTVLVNLIERGFGGPANAEGVDPFASETNWSTPNAAYFDHAAWLIDRAAERGFLVLLTPAYLGSRCGNQGWCDQMLAQSVDAMRAYGRFLGDRFRSKTNVVWVNGGDVDAGEFNMSSRLDAVAFGIGDRAPNHLQTAHCSRGNSAIDCYNEPWLDVNSTYSACDATLDRTRADWERSPPRPFFYIEGRYENEGASLGCLIDQHVWSVLGGSTGHMFGNGPVWEFVPGWQRDLDSPGALAMRSISNLFRSRGGTGFVPDHAGDLLPSGGGSGALAARTGDGSSLLVYVPSSRTITVNASVLSGTQAHAWWFDPADGDVQDLGQRASEAVLEFQSPGRRVLVLDDAARVMGPPGA